MIREATLEEISDGKLYEINDLVRADCKDCKNCHDCCVGMDGIITLNPLDIHRLRVELDMDFQKLRENYITLTMIGGLMLPVLNMGEQGACVFLNEKGRCKIHPARPDICRLFPLGRYYEEGTHRYILQKYECSNENREEVRVADWIQAGATNEFEQFIDQWHYLLKEIEQNLRSYDMPRLRQINNKILNVLFVMPFKEEKFYTQCANRISNIRTLL